MSSANLVLSGEPHFVSPYAFACFVALTEKKLPFDFEILDASKGETVDEGYLKRTVTGRVPSLRHGDFSLAESWAIIEYLEDMFPEVPVLPRDRYARARARQLASWLRSDETAALRRERSTDTMFYPRGAAPALGGDAAKSADKLVAVATRLLRDGAPFLFGGAWSIADTELAFMLHRLILNRDPVPGPLRSWADQQWSRPSVALWVNHQRPTLA